MFMFMFNRSHSNSQKACSWTGHFEKQPVSGLCGAAISLTRDCDNIQNLLCVG